MAKAQDLQLCELSVLLEASLCDSREDPSPWPVWEMEFSTPACFMWMGTVSCFVAIQCLSCS